MVTDGEEQPQRGLDLIGQLLPPSLDFTRKVRGDDSRDIFGSVSRVDVADLVRTLLSRNKEASRVAVQESDITFLGGSEEGIVKDRVGSLGTYDVEITVKGAQGSVTRPVNVLAEQSTSEALGTAVGN